MPDINTSLLVDQAYHAIKEDVLLKKLVPGKKINVQDISARYKISVTPIKLALNRLMIEGMVESIPRRGMVLKPISQKTLWETIEIRKMIELFCIPQVILQVRTNPDFLISLSNNLKLHERIITEVNGKDYYLDQNMIDSEFHLLLVSTLANERMLSIYRSLGTHLVMFYLYGVKRLKRFEESHQEHIMIFEAVNACNEEALRNSITKHLDNSYLDYLSTINTVINNCNNARLEQSRIEE